jgi:RNA polymerase sigma-70 factor (ECF subfamily)
VLGAALQLLGPVAQLLGDPIGVLAAAAPRADGKCREDEDDGGPGHPRDVPARWRCRHRAGGTLTASGVDRRRGWSHRPVPRRHPFADLRRQDVTVDENVMATQFEEHRTRLRAVAYRMLGSTTEAEDAVQEAWLRLSRSDAEAISNLAGWLTTVVARVALDMLKARNRRREDYVGSWLPEPVVTVETAASDPEREALIADSVGLALLVVLETLAPRERLAFVLHDMFAVSFREIAPIIDSTPDAARQMASRARRRVRGAPAVDTDRTRQRERVDAFLDAARGGDFDTLISVLDPDVVFRHDAGSGRRAQGPIVGAEAVARTALDRGSAFVGLAKPAVVNGAAGIIVASGDRLIGVAGITVAGGRIAEIDLITDPAKLRGAAQR